jgi:DNA-binding LacI/PurR family transcriptional regulator
MSHVTLRELAEAAKVSIAAASFAINNKPGVSAAKRKQILAVAKEIGYEPDATMTKLMAHVATRRTRDAHETLAVITRFGRLRVWEVNSSVAAFWTGAGARAKELGYHLEEFRYDEPGVTPQRLRGILRARGIQGLLFSMGPEREEEMHLNFDFEGFAAAMSGICFNDPAINFVVPDHFHNVLLALDNARVLGYRRPLLALPAGAGQRTLHRMEGAYHYFLSQCPEMTALPIFSSDTYDSLRLEAQTVRDRPDVIICTHGEWCALFAGRVPVEFGWISMNWMPGEKKLAGVDRRLEEQGGFVVDMVVAVIHRGEAGVPSLRKEVLVPGRFQGGPSLPPRGELGLVKKTKKAREVAVK